MPRDPETGAKANVRLQQARRGLPSPVRANSCLSRSELATAVNSRLHAKQILDLDIDANYVGKLEAGKFHWPRDPRRRWAFRAVLGVSTDAELGFYATRSGRADRVEQSGETGSADEAGSDPVTEPEGDPGHLAPDAWLQMLDILSASTLRDGHAGIYPIATEQLRRLGHARQLDSWADSRLAFVDARWSEFMSWVCDNSGTGDGAAWLARAYARAVEADQPHFVSYVLMRQSQQALDSGDARTAIARARDALHGDHLPPRTQALCMTRLAEGLALSGDDECLDLASIAARHAGANADHPIDAIAQHCDSRYVNAIHARCHYLLGDHADAARILEDVLADETPAAAPDAGLWLTHLADSYQPTDPEQAANAGSRALRLSQAYSSARIIRALLPLAVNLRPHRRLEPVDKFLTAHRHALSGA